MLIIHRLLFIAWVSNSTSSSLVSEIFPEPLAEKCAGFAACGRSPVGQDKRVSCK